MIGRWTRLAPFGLVAALLGGCGSGGQLGDNGNVRFSQVVRFAETPDFHAPVVVGSTLLVALQHPSGTGVAADPPTFTSLEVHADPVGHSGTAVVVPLGFAQYAVQFHDAGSYRLTALDSGTTLDTITVDAESAHALRLGHALTVATTGPDGHGGTCVAVTGLTSVDGLVLHHNQSLSATFVPTTGGMDDTAMLGLLQLTAHAPDTVSLDAPLLTQASVANTLEVTPSRATDGAADVQISDDTTGQSLTVHVGLGATDAPVQCP